MITTQINWPVNPDGSAASVNLSIPTFDANDWKRGASSYTPKHQSEEMRSLQSRNPLTETVLFSRDDVGDVYSGLKLDRQDRLPTVRGYKNGVSFREYPYFTDSEDPSLLIYAPIGIDTRFIYPIYQGITPEVMNYAFMRYLGNILAPRTVNGSTVYDFVTFFEQMLAGGLAPKGL